jgi:hypothetical protein
MPAFFGVGEYSGSESRPDSVSENTGVVGIT